MYSLIPRDLLPIAIQANDRGEKLLADCHRFKRDLQIVKDRQAQVHSSLVERVSKLENLPARVSQDAAGDHSVIVGDV